MNDFLHNLRNNKDERFDRNRRPYDSNSQYPGVDRANGNFRKKMMPRNGDLMESLPAIKRKTSGRYLREPRNGSLPPKSARRRRWERIASHFFTSTPEMSAEEQQLASPAAEAPVAESERPEASAAEPDRTDASAAEPDRTDAATAEPDRTDAKPATTDREKTVALIRELRDKGLSFEKIAQELQAQGIPTVSGRGYGVDRWPAD